MNSAEIIKFLTTNDVPKDIFALLFAKITEYNGELPTDEYKKFVNKAFEYNLNFDNIKITDHLSTSDEIIYMQNGMSLYYSWVIKHNSGLGCLTSQHLTYENLVKYLLRDQSVIKYDFVSVMISIKYMTDKKMRQLLEYCFDCSGGKVVQLTPARLAEFELSWQNNRENATTEVTTSAVTTSAVTTSINMVANDNMILSYAPIQTVTITKLIDNIIIEDEYIELVPSDKFYAEYEKLPKEEFVRYFGQIKVIDFMRCFKSYSKCYKFIRYAYMQGLNFANIREYCDGSEYINSFIEQDIQRVQLDDAIMEFYIRSLETIKTQPFILFNKSLTYDYLVKYLSAVRTDYDDYYHLAGFYSHLSNIMIELVKYSYEFKNNKWVHILLTQTRLAEFESQYAEKLATKKLAADKLAAEEVEKLSAEKLASITIDTIFQKINNMSLEDKKKIIAHILT